jgi:hypothetical protein
MDSSIRMSFVILVPEFRFWSSEVIMILNGYPDRVLEEVFSKVCLFSLKNIRYSILILNISFLFVEL